ncbi:ABC1 kinase family protein [Sporosarcina gallistercoris]|uniref:AarF/ABC1/UbiB kinase family protein n=1 Tax=Sporosarcina gallistercoris TaxID=2762245 RepID=A0ABR8PHI4_9BACL|nr:AarF/ABC1/UbiB kinase family protein [Sporosarcina gallistercoris]MBD7907618.1 AarF/ABC1/UbiB kinase family protein [Sporosarcina gallistercoris]
MMRLSIRRTYRFQEIVNTFLKNGFSHVLFRLGITERRAAAKMKSEPLDMNLQHIGQKLNRTLQELGPTFIKLGQIASTRRDLVPIEIIRELEKLQDHAEPFSFEEVQQIIEKELGKPLNDLFESFNDKPLATASIGQVHAAFLYSGEKVAVKVQRPDIRQTVDTDLAILKEIATIIENNTDWGKLYGIRAIIDEFADSLLCELDYETEGRNAERISRQAKRDSSVYIPEIHWAFSSKKVLTMEMIEGIKSNHIDALDEQGYDRKLLARKLVHEMFSQVLDHGFFHGDPHPGNIYILPGNVISFIDFGMIGVMDDHMKLQFAKLIMELERGSTKGIIKVLDAMGILHDETDIKSLQKDLSMLKTKYYDIPLQNMSLGDIFMELFGVAYRHRIKIPSEITVLGKTILTLEGLISKLDPTMSIMDGVEPFGKKLMREYYSPTSILKSAWESVSENAEILANIPRDFKDISTAAKKGKLKLDINLRQTSFILRRMDIISNRLAFSVILLAFSILMTGLIIGSAIAGENNMLLNLPVIEVGAIVAFLMFLFLLFSIFRSGRM